MEKTAVYPGSFDPVTKGHIDIINRSAALFDKLIIAVLENPSKKYWFNFEERVAMIKETLGTEKDKIIIKSFSGLLVDFMKQNNADVMIRGLRAVSDYEYELQLFLTNNSLSDGQIETVFLPASRENLYLSSSIVKEIALYDGKIDDMVDKGLVNIIKNKAKEYKEGKNDKTISG